MEYRKQKQVIIGLASLTVMLGAMFLLVQLVGDNIAPPQDKKDEIPDEALFRDPDVIFAEFFKISDGNIYDAVAYIKNSNTEYGASSVMYEFDFLGEGGEVLRKVSGETFILPGESKYIVESAVEMSAVSDFSNVKNMNFNMKKINWQRLAPFSPANLNIDNTDFSREDDVSDNRFSGVVNNTSPYNLKNVEVHAVLYKSGKPVAAGRTNMQDLLRGTARAFQIVWPYALPQDVDIDVRAESNFFKNSNFIRDYAASS